MKKKWHFTLFFYETLNENENDSSLKQKIKLKLIFTDNRNNFFAESKVVLWASPRCLPQNIWSLIFKKGLRSKKITTILVNDLVKLLTAKKTIIAFSVLEN